MTTRRPRRQLRPALADARADAPPMTKTDQQQLAELVELHRRAEHVEQLARSAKAILRENLPAYARLHLRAAQLGSERGDSRAAEWALSHVRSTDDAPPVVDQPAKGATDGRQIKVIIGVALGGLPPGTVTSQAITIPAHEDTAGDA